MSTEALAPATRTLPVPVDLAGPKAFAVRVNDWSLALDGIKPGDIVIVDPDRPTRNGALACVTITLQGRRGRLLRRIRKNGDVLEAASTQHPDIPVGPENHPVSDGLAVAVIRRLDAAPSG
jgi:SOS-response transcriptional repressor LexA